MDDQMIEVLQEMIKHKKKSLQSLKSKLATAMVQDSSDSTAASPGPSLAHMDVAEENEGAKASFSAAAQAEAESQKVVRKKVKKSKSSRGKPKRRKDALDGWNAVGN